MFNFLFDVSICVSMGSKIKIGCANLFRCVVVAFGNGQVDGALITLFNLYQASAAKKNRYDALFLIEFLLLLLQCPKHSPYYMKPPIRM